jgi:hypothetical protein
MTIPTPPPDPLPPDDQDDVVEVDVDDDVPDDGNRARAAEIDEILESGD